MRRFTFLNVLQLLFVRWSTLRAQDGAIDWKQWRELHAGIRYARLEAEHPRRMVVHGVRIDAWTPGLRLHTTSRRDEWLAGKTETGRQTTRNFLRQSRARGIPTVLAINADAFAPWPAPYDQPTPTERANGNNLGVAIDAPRTTHDSNLYLFVDDHWIAHQHGLTRIHNRARPLEKPVIGPDDPKTETACRDHQCHHSRTCYATSPDGIAWTKPVTDRETGTNYIRFEPPEPWVGGAGVMIDARRRPSAAFQDALCR